jgi:hypothetical protein
MAEPVDVDVDTIIERLLEGENILFEHAVQSHYARRMFAHYLRIRLSSSLPECEATPNFKQPVALLLML